MSMGPVVAILGRTSIPGVLYNLLPPVRLEGFRRIESDNAWQEDKPYQHVRTTSGRGRPPWPQHLQAA